jgi:hypothetical protein
VSIITTTESNVGAPAHDTSPPKKATRFVKLLRLYVFPNLEVKRWGGIWETAAVHDLTEKEPRWTLRLVIAWHGCRALDTTEEVPETVISYFGRSFDRDALRGQPRED